MLCRSPLVLILLSSLLALAAIADASPPDPIWVGGVYNGGDDDDVVLSLFWPGRVLAGARPQDLKPFVVVVGRLPARATAALAVATLRAFRFRSPPIP